MESVYSLNQIVGSKLEIGKDTQYQVRTKAVRLGRGVVDDVGALASEYMKAGHVLLVADHNTFPLSGSAVEAALRNGGFKVHTILLEDGEDGKVEADDAAVAQVEQAIKVLPEPRAGLVALGAGTLNDLAKLPAFRAGLPYGVVATAASMNGYTSAIAAILSGGVKRTISCAPPTFVVADLDLVSSAPIEMTRAGFGDLLSKPVSSGDWLLSHLLNGETFYEVPVRLVEDAFRRVQSQAKAIGRGDGDALGTLMEALLLSGISMASAGSSAPASGGEHLISHLWDMTASYRGRKVGLHGAQVGVATLVTATLYRHLQAERVESADVERRVAALEPFETYRRRLSSLPEALRPSVEVESRKQYPNSEELRARVEDFAARWDQVWDRLSGILQSPARLRELLGDTGAPTSVRELGIPEMELREAYRIARDIRARFTVLDLAWQVGKLEPLEEVVLKESGVI